MNLVTQVFSILVAVVALGAIVVMVRRGRLRERHAIWWLVGAILALIVAVFPNLLDWATGLLGFVTGANLIFFVSIAILVGVTLQHSAELTKLESQVRTLTEQLAIRRLEEELDEDADGESA